MCAVLICLLQSQISVIMSHFQSLLTSRPAVLLAVDESSVIFFMEFMPLPCQYHQHRPETDVCCLI